MNLAVIRALIEIDNFSEGVISCNDGTLLAFSIDNQYKVWAINVNGYDRIRYHFVNREEALDQFLKLIAEHNGNDHAGSETRQNHYARQWV